MKNKGIKPTKYVKKYHLSNIRAMIKNNKKSPHICTDKSQGKLIAITGATSGIGYATALKYAQMGADLICINRNKQKSEQLKQEIEKKHQVKCEYIIADFSKLEDTHQAAQKLLETKKPIDVLIHNAGIYQTKKQTTPDGIEEVFMINYLATFIINYKLKDQLKTQEKCRIILINSEGHRFAPWGIALNDLNWTKRHYTGLKSYGQAKLAQLLTMKKFDEYFKGSGVTINAMHPGAVQSSTGQANGPLYKWFKKNLLDKSLKPTSIAADAIYYLGTSKEMETIRGKYFNLTTLEEPAPPALDQENADLLWDISIEMGKLDE